VSALPKTARPGNVPVVALEAAPVRLVTEPLTEDWLRQGPKATVAAFGGLQ